MQTGDKIMRRSNEITAVSIGSYQENIDLLRVGITDKVCRKLVLDNLRVIG